MISDNHSKRAAKAYSLILQGICSIGVKTAGEAVNRDPSFISRLKTGENKMTLEEFCTLLIACDLEVAQVDKENITITKAVYSSLCEFAEIGLQFTKSKED